MSKNKRLLIYGLIGFFVLSNPTEAGSLVRMVVEVFPGGFDAVGEFIRVVAGG